MQPDLRKQSTCYLLLLSPEAMSLHFLMLLERTEWMEAEEDRVWKCDQTALIKLFFMVHCSTVTLNTQNFLTCMFTAEGLVTTELCFTKGMPRNLASNREGGADSQ